MLQAIVNLALQSARVLPAIDMLRDFSEAAEAEARTAAQSLMGLGLCLGAAAGLLSAAFALALLSHPIAAVGFLVAIAPCAYAGLLCKRRLDLTLGKLEQLKSAAFATRAAKNIASKTVEMGRAAYDSAVSGGRSAANAAGSAGSSAVASLSAAPGMAYDSASAALSPVGKSAQSKAGAAIDFAVAAGAALSDPATRQAASQLAGEAVNGIARGAGLAAGWLKSRNAAPMRTIGPEDLADAPPMVAAPSKDAHVKSDEASIKS